MGSLSVFFSQFFSQAGLLWGTLLVAVPIIIYLINRQRFRRRKWAAMEFLLRAMKKNRRRLQVENLLLLLLRCAIIALIAMAMARPFVRSRVLGQRSTAPENWIFALDTSYSMGLREGTRTLFEMANEALTRIVRLVVKPGDRVAIVTLDAKPRRVLEPLEVTKASRAQILQAIDGLRPGHESVNLASSLRVILDVAREFESTGASEVALVGKKLIIFSDFQRRDWLLDDAPRDPAANELFGEFDAAGVMTSRADLKGTTRNLALMDLGMSPPIASRDVWVEFFATVRNFGRQDFDTVEVIFRVDGVDQPTHLLRLPAGEAVTRAMQYRFTTPGYHAVTVEALVDDLPADNQRYLAVNVRESADILLVDGEPGDTAIDRETLLLELALMPDDSDEFRRAPYNPVLTSVDQMLGDSSELYDNVAVVLANVAAADLPAVFVDDLRRFVEEGGALLVFLGKNVIPDDYNRLFAGGPDSLLPLELKERVERDANPAHVRFVDTDHPVARYFLRRRAYTYLERPFVEFRRYFRFANPEEDAAVALLLRFDDPQGNLAAFDHTVGRGRVMWFASTADLEWNDFAKYPDFIPFLHESIPYLVNFGESSINLALGEPYRQFFDAHEYSPRVVIIPPRAGKDEQFGVPPAIPKQMHRLEGENRFELTHEETTYPGIYELRLQQSIAETEGEGRRVLFAVNLDPSEGDLRRVSTDELSSFFPDFKAEVFDASERVKEIATSRSAASGTELWRTVLWLVLCLLVAESVLAWLFGRRVR